MKTAKNNIEVRILIGAILIGLLCIGLGIYDAYSQEMKKELSEKIAEHLPDLNNSLAQQ